MNLKKIVSAVTALTIILTAYTGFAAPPEQEEYSGEFSVYKDLIEFVAENYINDSYTSDDIMIKGLSELLKDNEPLLIEFLKATLESLDDYSEFYTAEEYKKFQDRLNKTFYGIGVAVKQTDNYVEIVGFTEGNDNAQKAGFEIGDKIIKVNGDDVTGLDLQAVIDRLIGEEGTTVSVTVLRGNSSVELTAPRVAVSDKTVSAAIFKGNIGYIQIVSFNLNTYDEFAQALDMMREKDVKNIILDLRNNGGGVVAAATNIAKLIVPKGKIIDVSYRQPQYNLTYNSSLDKKEFDFAVLVNGHTASSSEILASAIQESGAGKIVGEKTFGKAVIQNTYTMSTGAAIKLTVGRYITRNGNEINNEGIKPDIEVKDTITSIDMSAYTPFDFSSRTALGGKSDNVKSAKEKLSVLGIYEGDAESDVLDTEFKNALRQFQRQNDILAYGVLDIVTQKTIDKVFSKIEISDDKQLETAYTLLGGNLEDLKE